MREEGVVLLDTFGHKSSRVYHADAGIA